MRARTINKTIKFERGQDPKDAMSIGRVKERREKEAIENAIEMIKEIKGSKIIKKKEFPDRYVIDFKCSKIVFELTINRETELIIDVEGVFILRVLLKNGVYTKVENSIINIKNHIIKIISLL